ncbi:putative hydrolase [Colletotrichum orbiculare MAFF 240422]|uniref:Hydrolase n=1 Tax=Colletotrichum orbiculare (strain 104-T / ATCC 96160 / CBS 514.97 / LARS 414 / MAFF 240422) TaxID=1213857 RepID=N4VLQ9_COLOR|nr:putative hydrolase [Colletotrichum orbiculare MAFF 240422]
MASIALVVFCLNVGRCNAQDQQAVPIVRADSPFGSFPMPKDPFKLMPCTKVTTPPALNDSRAEQNWAALFDPEPSHWSWGINMGTDSGNEDPYAGRGIFLCGYLDVPLDYTNKSDPRVVRLAVTKFQVSGLARVTTPPDRPRNPPAGSKSKRTIIVNPGGPGGSGTASAWRGAQNVTKRWSDGAYDVLGWDPRGVNATLPSIACSPHDALRDRWSLARDQFLEVSDVKRQLRVADALNEATMRACWERHGDLGRFMGTASVARDLDEIRKALGEDEVTGYLVSYGTGIGQTYANMFPDRVGRIILDGTEYVRDHRLLGGFGYTALDNATDAWREGFLGECLKAGPDHCALAKTKPGGGGGGGGNPVASLKDLETRMTSLLDSLVQRPVVGYTSKSGPSVVTYSQLVSSAYSAMYNPASWPAFAQMLHELDLGNATLAAEFLDRAAWQYDPSRPPGARPSSDELTNLVICADAYDAPPQELPWWESLWRNMTARSWIAGNGRFSSVFPCRHFNTYWPRPAEVYRGDLNYTLKNPVLLIAEVYDPATPLRNGRRLLREMGRNARLIVHHGYGHASRDASNCTDEIGKLYILEGKLPGDAETDCFANEKPYLYGVRGGNVKMASSGGWDPVAAWEQHLAEVYV